MKVYYSDVIIIDDSNASKNLSDTISSVWSVIGKNFMLMYTSDVKSLFGLL